MDTSEEGGSITVFLVCNILDHDEGSYIMMKEAICNIVGCVVQNK
jgi:hypothetical protein